MNLTYVIPFFLIIEILSSQSLSESINVEEKREFSDATSFPFLPYRAGSRLLSALFPKFDYNSYWYTRDYTSAEPDEDIEITGRDYWYSTDRNYWLSTGRPYWYTTGRNYWYTSGKPYQYTTGRHYWYTTGKPDWFTSRRPYWSTAGFRTRVVTGITGEPSDVTTYAPSTTTAQPMSSTTDVTPTKHEYKGMNNFFAEKIIFIGNNIFISNKNTE